MVATDLVKGGRYMATERITIKQGKRYYLKPNVDIGDAINRLGELEDEEDAKTTVDADNSKMP